MINAIHIVGQILFGGYFVWSGYNHFASHRDFTAYASMNKVPMAGTAVYFTGLLLALGGLGVLFNFQLRIALALLVLFLIPVTFTMHAFWKLDNPGEKAAQRIQFTKNMALLGATLLMF